jgi:hypothetical protein
VRRSAKHSFPLISTVTPQVDGNAVAVHDETGQNPRDSG